MTSGVHPVWGGCGKGNDDTGKQELQFVHRTGLVMKSTKDRERSVRNFMGGPGKEPAGLCAY